MESVLASTCRNLIMQESMEKSMESIIAAMFRNFSGLWDTSSREWENCHCREGLRGYAHDY